MRRAATVLVVILAVVLAGCGKKTHTRDDFRKAVLGLKTDQVRRQFGAPDDIAAGEIGGYVRFEDATRPRVNQGGRFSGIWTYQNQGLTYNPKTRTVDDWVLIFFTNNIARDLQFPGDMDNISKQLQNHDPSDKRKPGRW